MTEPSRAEDAFGRPAAEPPTEFLPPMAGPAEAPPELDLGGWDLASRWARVGASIIDALIISAVILLGLALNQGLAVALYLLVLLLYAPLLMVRSGPQNGQTVGKQVLGIRVVREDREPVGFATVAVREILAKDVLNFVTGGLFGFVDSLWCLWDPRKQCLHDKMAKTLVVKD